MKMWILVICGVFCGLVFYLLGRFAHVLGFHFSSRYLQLLVSFLFLLLILSVQVLPFLWDVKLVSVLGTLGSWLFILVVVLAVLMGIEQLISFVLLKFAIGPSVLKTCITIGIFCVIFGIGFFNAFSTKVTEVTLSSQKISHPVRILFVADLHVDDVIATWHLHTLKREISSLHPDVLLFGGDFFNTTNPQYVQYYSVLKDLTIPMFGVGGNHDHGSHRGNKDSGILQRLQTFANITLLDQETSGIVLEDLGIQLLGVMDKGQRAKYHFDTPQDLLSQKAFSSDLFTILLTHQPIALEKLEDFPIDLELAGHVHRGQVYGIRELAAWLNDYGYGWFERDGKGAFVTQGIGTWGLPLRLGSRSEIVVIDLLPNE